MSGNNSVFITKYALEEYGENADFSEVTTAMPLDPSVNLVEEEDDDLAPYLSDNETDV